MTQPSSPPRSWTLQPGSLPDTDVAVAGGGIAGVFAALAAAAQGARTILIEQHAFVGGQATAGGVIHFCGETRIVSHSWSEMVARLEAVDAIVPYHPDKDARLFDCEWLKFVLQEMLREAGATLLLHTQVAAVERDGEEVNALILYNKSGLQRIKCRQVIDASGDADVVARAGFDFDKGGQVFVPGEKPKAWPGKTMQLPMSLYFTLIDTGEPVKPVLPEGCPKWESKDELPMTTVKQIGPHLVSVKMKVIGHDATDGLSLSEAEQEGRRQMMGLVYFLQTHGYGRDTPLNTYRLGWVAPHIGIREGRRVKGQYRLTSDDVISGRSFEDAVAVGSYHLDYHWPSVMQRAGTGITGMVPPYHIPLRALRPEGSANLLVPGRCVSGDQLAMSSYRVMGSCAATGHAAGTIAGMALRQNLAISDLDIPKVQKTLLDTGVRLDKGVYENYHSSRRSFREFIFEPPADFVPSHHASTVVQMPDGSILAAWFGGTREGHEDVGIWFSRKKEGAWSTPRCIVQPQGEACWNPVLFLPDTHRLNPELYGSGANKVTMDETGFPRLLLYYRTGVSAKAWTTWVKESTDGGETWSEPVPFQKGLLGPIKNKPVVLSNGDWFSGSSFESETENYCVMEISRDQGRTWEASDPIRDPEHPLALIQPTVWESSPGHLHALMRNRTIRKNKTPGQIWRVDSTDYGKTWSAPYPTDLPSNDSGLDIAKLMPWPGEPGHSDDAPAPLALIFNPVETAARSPLSIWLSYDNGLTWPDRVALEDDPEGKFAYPAAIPCPGGLLLTYTWNRLSIICGRFGLQLLREVARGDRSLPQMGDPLAEIRELAAQGI